ncbi:MAG: hypothetical protein AB7O57_08870 [Hyphomicrobiaceae bacterium]
MSVAARAVTDARVAALVRASLALWRVDATLALAVDGSLTITAHELPVIVVSRAPPAIPFRWLISRGGRDRPASSVAGLLRVLRSTLDPSWRGGRARVVPLSPPLP